MRYPVALTLLAVLGLATPGLAAVAPSEAGVRSGFKQLQVAMDRDDRAAYLKLSVECLEAVRQGRLLELLPEALSMRGEALMGGDQDALAHSYILNALGLAVELGNDRIRANALNDLGILADREGNPRAAYTYYREALEVIQGVDDPQALDAIAFDLASAEVELGELEAGFTRMQEVVKRARDRKDRYSELKALVRLADIEGDRKHPEEAARLADEALALARELKHPMSEQAAFRVKAAIALEAKAFDDAEKYLKSALAAARQSHDDWAEASAAFDLGSYYIRQNQVEKAKEPLLLAQRGYRKLGKTEYVDQLREVLKRLEEGKSL